MYINPRGCLANTLLWLTLTFEKDELSVNMHAMNVWFDIRTSVNPFWHEQFSAASANPCHYG